MADEPTTPSLEIDGALATIRLRRAQKRNRIEPPDIVAIIEHCDVIDADPDVRVVVLTADGPSFCAGYHLGALSEGATVEASFGDLCDRIEAVHVPVIARIDGDIHGGGTDLAIACDIRVARAGIALAMPATKLGIQYYATGLRRFVEQIGPAATKRLFLTALPVDAEALLAMGYVQEVVPAADLDARVDEMAAAVAALGPLAVASTKAAINGLAQGTMTVDEAEASHRASLRSDDHAEALAALAERRPPNFTGR
ncbi:MAG: enoyl-CoA hydratase/isomerase family protein [Actinomycetota bacterium]